MNATSVFVENNIASETAKNPMMLLIECKRRIFLNTTTSITTFMEIRIKNYGKNGSSKKIRVFSFLKRYDGRFSVKIRTYNLL